MMIDHKAPTAPTLYGQYAGFVTRMLALMIDLVLLSLFATITTATGQFFVQMLTLDRWTKVIVNIATLLVIIGAVFVYEITFVTLAGQTIGKRVMGVRIVGADGSRVKPSQALKRLAGWLLSLPLFWGFLISLVDDQRRAFDDRLAGTLVIYAWPEPDRDFTTPVISAAVKGVRRRMRGDAENAPSANKG